MKLVYLSLRKHYIIIIMILIVIENLISIRCSLKTAVKNYMVQEKN